MHTMWKGSIQFGLVNIPIKMHAATEDKDVKFRNLHKNVTHRSNMKRFVLTA